MSVQTACGRIRQRADEGNPRNGRRLTKDWYDVNENEHTDEHWHGACSAGIFHAVFRLIAISDLYGPARAIEWAQSLIDDPELLLAFAHAPERPIAELTVRRLGLSGSPLNDPGWGADFPNFN